MIVHEVCQSSRACKSLPCNVEVCRLALRRSARNRAVTAHWRVSAGHSVTNDNLSGWQADGTYQTLVQKHMYGRGLGRRLNIPCQMQGLVSAPHHSLAEGTQEGSFASARSGRGERTPMWKLYGLSLTVLILTTANRPVASLAQHSLSCVKESAEAITVRRLNANCECPGKRAI